LNHAERKVYFENPNKENWDHSQIKRFWVLIWKYHVNANNFIFHGYVFPKSLHGSFHDISMYTGRDYDKFKTLFSNARFVDCEFLDDISFTNIHFEGDTKFRNVVFRKGFEISKCDLGNLEFNRAEFEGGLLAYRLNGLCLNIYHSNIGVRNELYINTISECHLKKLDIQYSTFNHELSIYDNYTSDGCLFSLTKFNGSLTMLDNQAEGGTQFIKTVFDSNHSTIIELNQGENPEFLSFHNTELNNSVTLKNIDFEQLMLNKTAINGAKFRNYRNVSTRPILNGELNEMLSPPELSEVYRELKISFENDKNWDLASKTFRSEMKMKRKSIFNKKMTIKERLIAAIEYSFYVIYEGLSGYNQSAVRPLSILLGTIVAGVAYLYFLEGNSLNDSMQLSFSASFPYLIKVPDVLHYDVWWVKLIQTLLSSILIAFFIIALRKKFKQ